MGTGISGCFGVPMKEDGEIFVPDFSKSITE
jgi:hypothetical protein